MEENPGTDTTIFMYCIAGYALSRVIHCIQSENNYLETLTGIWNGFVQLTVGIWLSIQTWEPPPLTFCCNPPPFWDVIGYWNVDQTTWPYCLSTWLCGLRMVKPFPRTSMFWTVLKSNQVVGLAWIWIIIRFVNKCSTDMESSSFSSLYFSESACLLSVANDWELN